MIDTTGTISYVAGSELTGKVPDYYEGLDVPIGGNLTVDHDGNIYVATSADGVIRKRLRSGEIQELGSVKWPFGRMAIGKDNSLLMLQTAAPAAAGVTGQQAMPDEPQLELVTFLLSGERSEPRRITGMPKVGLCEDLITTNGGTAYFSCGANIYRIDNI